MYYRSYGLLLLIIAVLIASQGFRDRVALGSCIAGLILLIDLPLRYIGQIVPWREDCVVHWYISRYRGSHIFLIPTWIVGVAGLLLGFACFVSPSFEKALTRRKGDPVDVQKKDETPPNPQPKGTLELMIEPVGPVAGTKFRYAIHNRTGEKISGVTEVLRYKAPVAVEENSSVPRADLFPNESRQMEFQVYGATPDWVQVTIKGVGPDQKAIQVERKWERLKK